LESGAGLTGSDAGDVASLLSSDWRAMRKLVLSKHRVQEFHFRQYLFAAQVSTGAERHFPGLQIST
jgi:hypothetical protein